jgi:HlyD family secretion protein
MLVGLTLVVGGSAWCAYSDDNARPTARPAEKAGLAPGRKIIALGTIEPEEVAEVCPQVAGRIVSLGADPHARGKPIDYGSRVEAGTLLAQIDNELSIARVEQERAACARAEAELAQARIHLERAAAQWKQAQDQKKNKAISDSDFDLAQFNYRTVKASVAGAEAALAQNRAALKQAEIELSYTAIKSPIQGVIIDRRVSVGQVVAPANAPSLFLIAKVDRLRVWASVNEVDIAKIHPQQAVRFTVDAQPGKVFEGKVEQVRLNAAMTQNVVTYTVVVSISGATNDLLPYMTAQLEFE